MGSTSLDSQIGLVMGSQSDWETMTEAANTLNSLEIKHDCQIVSAHRTPDLLAEYGKTAESRGIKVIIAGAGGSAHLPGMLAAHTHLPVLGVPIKSAILNGVDSLLSIVQMPKGVPVPTLAIGKSGAINAALSAASILALSDAEVRERLIQFRDHQTKTVLENNDPSLSSKT